MDIYLILNSFIMGFALVTTVVALSKGTTLLAHYLIAIGCMTVFFYTFQVVIK